jgi:hypothetical protein
VSEVSYFCYVHNWSSPQYKCPSCHKIDTFTSTTGTGPIVTVTLPDASHRIVIDRSEYDRLKAENAELWGVIEFYADKDGEHWAACQPQDTKDTCCHMVCENSGGEKARAILEMFKK